MDESPPITNGSNGRDRLGRFTVGNPGGPGSPHVAKVAKLRAALFATVSAKDLRKIIKALVKAAMEGDTTAAKVLLERLLGPPIPLDFEERLAALESRLLERSSRDEP